MHKIFAKTRLLGKKVIFLPQCHSTNAIANDILIQNPNEHGTVIYTENQTHGKGQRGNIWESHPHLNATFTLIVKPNLLKIKDQFALHIITSLAVLSALRDIIKVTVKWPNDIYIDDKKIAGILIENSLRGEFIHSSVIGIGININQTQFEYVHASSLKLETGSSFSIEEIIERVLIQLEKNFELLEINQFEHLRSKYLDALYQMGEKKFYKTPNGIFEGIISGISESGKLQIKIRNNTFSFDFKEVEFLKSKNT